MNSQSTNSIQQSPLVLKNVSNIRQQQLLCDPFENSESLVMPYFEYCIRCEGLLGLVDNHSEQNIKNKGNLVDNINQLKCSQPLWALNKSKQTYKDDRTHNKENIAIDNQQTKEKRQEDEFSAQFSPVKSKQYQIFADLVNQHSLLKGLDSPYIEKTPIRFQNLEKLQEDSFVKFDEDNKFSLLFSDSKLNVPQEQEQSVLQDKIVVPLPVQNPDQLSLNKKRLTYKQNIKYQRQTKIELSEFKNELFQESLEKFQQLNQENMYRRLGVTLKLDRRVSIPLFSKDQPIYNMDAFYQYFATYLLLNGMVFENRISFSREKVQYIYQVQYLQSSMVIDYWQQLAKKAKIQDNLMINEFIYQVRDNFIRIQVTTKKIAAINGSFDNDGNLIFQIL